MSIYIFMENWLAQLFLTLQSVLKWRVIKFGVVGFLGTVINLGVLFFGEEYLFTELADPGLRLNMSLIAAIALSTLHNFVLNRYWTWRERREPSNLGIIKQFWRYILASAIGILLQFFLTKALSLYLHYLIANAVSILLIAVLNYLVNDIWTFKLKRPSNSFPA